MDEKVLSNAPHGHMTEERRLIRDSARDFAMNEVLPVANELDPVQGDIPMSLRQKLADMGYFGILTPEDLGGLGLGCFEYCLVTEELSRAWMSVGSIIRQGNRVPRAQFMTDEQWRELSRKASKGEYLGALAMSEPQTGSDISGIKTRAVRDGDDWVITGNKCWCTFADGADYITVIARTDQGTEDRRHIGLTAFMLDKERGKFPKGLSGSPLPKIGYFGWKTWELAFDGVRVPTGAIIGEEGKAFYDRVHGLETARAHTAARAIGLAQGALEDATKYALEREQFGRPIAHFQAIRFKIANMATEVEAARQLLHFVCSEIDTGRRCDKEASMAKYFATEMAERVTSEAIQIHGGAGYTKHFQVERYWRDARLTKIFEGTSEIQQQIISDRILGRHRDPVAKPKPRGEKAES
ncbi:MAG: acyl-CoA dehydrogenase [Betaproteobacteria bacterium]|nr:acyl-CoA dehydrogenase [Betaproteobacteria bacterium]